MTRFTVAANLRRMRHAHGRSLSWLSERTGISVSTLSRIELAQQPITTDHVDEYARSLRCSVAELLEMPTRRRRRRK